MNKRKNQKGFTLVELLAVVVIMLTISIMAVSSISAAIERNKKKQNEAKIKIIANYTELYYQEHKSVVDSSCFNVDYLMSHSIITRDEGTDADGDIFTGSFYIDEYGNAHYDTVVCHDGK